MERTPMKPSELRMLSIRRIEKIGLPVPPKHLPLPDLNQEVRSASAVLNRIACLAAIVPVCFGLDGRTAEDWLRRHSAFHELAEEEKRLLGLGKGAARSALARSVETRIEALWALVWSVSLIDHLDWRKYCGDNLRQFVPEVEKDESLDQLRSMAKLRDTASVIAEEDLAYCLDWTAVQMIAGAPVNGVPVRAYVYRERRHALTWLLRRDSWDEVETDT